MEYRQLLADHHPLKWVTSFMDNPKQVLIFSLQTKVCSAQFRNWKLEKYMALEDKIASANKKSPETSIWIQEQLQLEHELSTQQW